MVFPYLPSLSGMCVCLGKVSALPGVPKMPLTLRKHTLWGKRPRLWDWMHGFWSPP